MQRVNKRQNKQGTEQSAALRVTALLRSLSLSVFSHLLLCVSLSLSYVLLFSLSLCFAISYLSHSTVVSTTYLSLCLSLSLVFCLSSLSCVYLSFYVTDGLLSLSLLFYLVSLLSSSSVSLSLSLSCLSLSISIVSLSPLSIPPHSLSALQSLSVSLSEEYLLLYLLSSYTSPVMHFRRRVVEKFSSKLKGIIHPKTIHHNLLEFYFKLSSHSKCVIYIPLNTKT